MYFDDVSREHSVGWTPTNELRFGSISSRAKIDAQVAKAKAIRNLFGHDIDSASNLSRGHIMEETLGWAKDSGLVGPKARYDALLGMDVSEASTLVGCLATFWKSVAAFIRDNADEHYPLDIWKTDGLEFSRAFIVVLPKCQELYSYETMKTLYSAIEFSKKTCTHYGRKFGLVKFHPRYENSPRMLSPRKHSPFPSLGLHVDGDYEYGERNDEIHESDATSVPIEPEESSEVAADDISKADIDDFIINLSQKKRSLESLFNSPAATKSEGAESARPDMHERSSGAVVLSTTQKWIKENIERTTTSDNGGPYSKAPLVNSALVCYANTTDDRWTVSEASIAEDAYADVWDEISNLFDYGVRLEKKRGADDSVAGTGVVSAMFVAKNFSLYSARDFKEFAISVNGALKHLTGGKLFLELFHPEYMGKGRNDALRRSPYPMLQICYRLGRINE